MAGRGYKGLTEKNLVGFHTELAAGGWASVDVDAARKQARGRGELPALAFFKLLVVEAIDGLVAAQGADNDVQRCDGPWDDAQRRLVLTVQLRMLSPDLAVRADAAVVQAQLCPDGSTSMTSLEAEDEVDFARNQVRLARSPGFAPLVARLGLEELVDEIERRTDDLARALGRDGEARSAARWQRVQQAKRACVGAFNFAHEGVTKLAETAADPLEKARYEELLAPFERLLARRTTANAQEGDAEEKDGEEEKGGAEEEKPADEKLRPTG